MISNKQCGFRELSEEKDFFDVTLACDDSQIQAHKVILSACSPFFLFPLLYLKGVKYKELLSVLNFMYIERLMWLKKNSIPLFLADRFTKESVEKEADAIVNLLERNESEEAKEDNSSSSETP